MQTVLALRPQALVELPLRTLSLERTQPTPEVVVVGLMVTARLQQPEEQLVHSLSPVVRVPQMLQPVMLLVRAVTTAQQIPAEAVVVVVRPSLTLEEQTRTQGTAAPVS